RVMRACVFFNDTATTEIYTLSLHDALPICRDRSHSCATRSDETSRSRGWARSEEHTSELQSHSDLVCRLLLEKNRHQRPDASHRHRDEAQERRETAHAHI